MAGPRVSWLKPFILWRPQTHETDYEKLAFSSFKFLKFPLKKK